MNYYCIASAVLIGAIVIYDMYKSKISTSVPDDNKFESKSQVIFFTSSNVLCRRKCLPRRIRCGPDCSLPKLRKIIKLFNNAKKTIDVCVYLITCNDITSAIVRAFKRGVKIRVIIDHDMATSTESKVSWFVKEGIPVKSLITNVLMHHKFCVFDDSTVLTGSMNWTLQGLSGNSEYVTISNQPVLALEFHNEFEQLWNTNSVSRIK